MPAAIEHQVKDKVINQWLSGETRDKIAADNGIGAGTVSGIINHWEEGLGGSDFQSVRELAIYSKKQGISLNELASCIRLNNYIKNIGTNFDLIEPFIANLAKSSEPQELINVANEIAQLSTSESIPINALAEHIKQQQQEKQRLDEEIKQAGAILQSKNVDIETINEFTRLREELSKHRLSTEDTSRLLSILQTIRQIGHDPKKIVAEFSNIKSLRRREKEVKNNCKMLEKRAQKYESVIPLAKQMLSTGITSDKLLPFSILVNETAQYYNLPISDFAFRVIKEIEDARRVGGFRRELSTLSWQLFMLREISSRQNKAIMALLKLQSFGITEEQILQLHNHLETNSVFDGTLNGRGF